MSTPWSPAKSQDDRPWATVHSKMLLSVSLHIPLSVLQITSLFMHISPALVCWAWRWYPDPSVVKFDQMSAEQLKAYNTASWWDIGVLSMSSYMIWVVLYYIKVGPLPVFEKEFALFRSFIWVLM